MTIKLQKSLNRLVDLRDTDACVHIYSVHLVIDLCYMGAFFILFMILHLQMPQLTRSSEIIYVYYPQSVERALHVNK